MPKFNFRLQGYLELKSKMEDQRKQEYAQAMSALERERAELAEIEARRSKTVSSFREDMSGAVNPETAGFYNNYLTWLKESANVQARRVRLAGAEAERRREALTGAMKERKMLETLRDKDYADYVHEQNLAEQKAADETVSFRRSSKEPG